MEYTRFGNGYIQREDADHEWQEVPPDDAQLAVEALLAEKERIAHELAHRPPRVKITRANGDIEEYA